MLWWSLVLTLFGAWILALAAGYSLGGAVHLLLLAGLGATAFRTWQERRDGSSLTPRRPDRRSASRPGRPRGGNP